MTLWVFIWYIAWLPFWLYFSTLFLPPDVVGEQISFGSGIQQHLHWHWLGLPILFVVPMILPRPEGK
ncbi:uncharacterized protein METZ01_LOCUS209102 [marine metagenome]|uniref:Uncharacterized protein n=1 Tax=marine metagenome TaxID=408172 RepID=A0A382EZS0_9ZZZZ